jgi:hypothetical protein
MSDTSVKNVPAPAAITTDPKLQATVTAPEPPARPRGRKKNPLLVALEAVASLRLTVVLFALSLLLVFFGTLAQIDAGIWTVVKDYFRSFFVWIPVQLLVQFGQVFFGLSKTMTIPGAIPFPGGWTLGALLLVNMLAAYGLRYKLFARRFGILALVLGVDAAAYFFLLRGLPLTSLSFICGATVLAVANLAVCFACRLGVLMLHAGLILMLAGEFITGVWAIEGNMVIEEGETTNVVIHNRQVELAVVDSSGKTEDTITVVPGRMLKQHEKGAAISHDDLPFDIEVVKWMVNSELDRAAPKGENLATKGFGLERIAVERGEVSGVAARQTVETPSVYVKLTSKKDGSDLGTYLLSILLKEQPITVDDKTYDVSLRFKHTYKPYSLELEEFRFDRYAGTSTPKNFSSRVRLRDPEFKEDREVTIRMNDPLRHRGDALFQSDWNKETERGTVLQIVRNPAWELPYWSCVLVSLGMISHFFLNLVSFLQRRANG